MKSFLKVYCIIKVAAEVVVRRLNSESHFRYFLRNLLIDTIEI